MTKIVIDPDLSGSEKEVVKQYLPAHSYAIVSDDNTHEALGKRVLDALSATGGKHIFLDHYPLPSMEFVEKIRAESKENQAIIAVGSGTINDLCKYGATLDNKSYGVFATAPSMNGYVSSTATIWADGQKRSFECRPPKALWCDLGVLSAAPDRLILSGLGDSLCRPTAQADWLLSHLLLDTPYLEQPFTMLSEYETDLFDAAARLTKGDLHALSLLMQTLIASGKGMQMAGSSAPASQGEHMIAHTMEMIHGNEIAHRFHGEQIGVLTLMMANLQRKILTRTTPPTLTYRPPPTAWGQVYRRKIPDKAFVDALNTRISERWLEIVSTIRNVTLQPVYLREVLESSGAPATLDDIGWQKLHCEEAARLAPYTRERFTFLDIALLAGIDPLD